MFASAEDVAILRSFSNLKASCIYDFSQQKILIEYIMLDGVNDEEQHAHQLGKLLETFQVVSSQIDHFYFCLNPNVNWNFECCIVLQVNIMC